MQNSFSRELAHSLAVMLLEMQAELEEFAYQMDQATYGSESMAPCALESSAQA